MNRLLKIARSASPGTGVQFRKSAYGVHGVRQFLRDIVAMANARIDGNRHIVVGIDFDRKGGRRLHSVAQSDFSGKPSYQSLVTDFIEPPIRVKYQAVTLEGKQIGVFEIGDCQDRPYMMRVDQSETLRRGDAYIRVNDAPVKMGRRQLQDLFEQRFRDSVSPDRIEVGFAGEIIHKDFRLPTADLSQLPSAVASTKLQQLIEIRSSSRDSGSTTVMARLTHARLFGSDSPYEDRSPSDLLREMAQIKKQHYREDQHFLFETHASRLQLVVFNQGEEPIKDASLSLVLPNHNAFYVASNLPWVPHNGRFVDRGPDDSDSYPSVSLRDDSVEVTNNIGDIPTDAPAQVFDTPLRICVGSDLKGRRFGVRYSLYGRNLRTPAKGQLRLIFQDSPH